MPYDITDAKEDILMLQIKFNQLIELLHEKGIIKEEVKKNEKQS